ncbi:MAG: hypothetical protein ACP5MD_16110, partial [Verrucomicrobiia bacterium]
MGVEVSEDDAEAGYLMIAPAQNDWSHERIPEEWRSRNGRLAQTWRDRLPQEVWVSPNGEFFTMPHSGGVKMWWQPAPFALCLNCGEFYTAREREFIKLASLSSEARTSATTALATSLLRRAASLAAPPSGDSNAREQAKAGTGNPNLDKLLTFTDNRQGASLQAGHFNDFIHVSLLRCALHAALAFAELDH